MSDRFEIVSAGAVFNMETGNSDGVLRLDDSFIYFPIEQIEKFKHLAKCHAEATNV